MKFSLEVEKFDSGFKVTLTNGETVNNHVFEKASSLAEFLGKWAIGLTKKKIIVRRKRKETAPQMTKTTTQTAFELN